MIEWEDESSSAHSEFIKQALDVLGAVCLMIVLALAFILFN